MQITNAQGQARFLSLIPGDYQLAAELEGFATAREPVSIFLGRNTTREIVLSLAVSG